MPPVALQVALPEPIAAAPAQEVQERIVRARKALGDRLVVLGHHYQRDEVIRHAGVTGDSTRRTCSGPSRASPSAGS